MNLKTASARTLLIAIAWVTLTATAWGQRRRERGAELPQPVLHSVFSPGVQRGSTVDVTLEGIDLDQTGGLWLDHPSLSATHVNGRTYRIQTTGATPLGYHDVRVITPLGVSNPRTLAVGDRLETLETEPNDRLESAERIVLNSVKNGKIAKPTDVDWFGFELKAAANVSIGIESERVDSNLDATMYLLDGQGHEIADSRDAEGADPLIDVRLEPGRYFIKVQDVTYKGSNDSGYRLTLTDAPRLIAIEPAFTSLGETRRMTLFGWNLGGKEDGPFVDGRRVETKVVEIKAPDAIANLPWQGLANRSPVSSGRGFEYAVDSPSGRSNPIFIALADDPVLLESTIPVDAAGVGPVQPPCLISGRFGVPNDVDTYRFSAKKGTRYWIEANSESIGSKADPGITIQEVAATGGTNDLEIFVDRGDQGGSSRFSTATVDPSGIWTAPHDGTFQIQVSDLFSSQRGDIRLAYGLVIREARPDFRLVALPESANRPDAITIPVAGRALGYVLAIRSDGFSGPIQVAGSNLPVGIHIEPVVIPAGQSFAPIVIEASADAPRVPAEIKLVGHTTFADRKNSLTYQPGVNRFDTPSDLAREAEAGVVIWEGPVPDQNGNVASVPPARFSKGFIVLPTEVPSFRLSTSVSRKVMTPNGWFSVDFEVERRKGFEEAVVVTLVNNAPRLQNVPAITIPKNETKGTFAFPLPNEMSVGIYSWVFQGVGPHPFNIDPKAANKPVVNLSEPSNPLNLIIRASPLTLTKVSQGAQLKAGGELDVEFKGEGAPGRYPLTLVAPSSLKLSASEAVLEGGANVKWKIRAAADAPAGQVTVGVKAVVDGIDQVVPLVLTIVK